MTDAIAIRIKIAELCGFSDLSWCYEPFVTQLKGFKFGLQIPVPKYETSIDAIAQAFNDHGLTWFLDGDGYAYHIKNGLKTESYAETPALALCKLFIDLMESRNAK